MEAKVKTKTLVFQRIYKNMELANWIESFFDTEDEKLAAWQTAFQIGRMYPEVADKIRGELIDEDTQEEK